MQSPNDTGQPPGKQTHLQRHIASSVIGEIIRRHGGIAPTANAMEKHLYPGHIKPPPQRLALWRDRGWASPMHFMELVPLLPAGKGIADLYLDRVLATQAQERDEAEAAAAAEAQTQPA